MAAERKAEQFIRVLLAYGRALGENVAAAITPVKSRSRQTGRNVKLDVRLTSQAAQRAPRSNAIPA